MAQVVLLRGVNVGGYRTFRPSVLAKQLERFDVVNVGAAGTFVVRKTISRTRLRAELIRRLPFATEVMICDGKDILRVAAAEPFARHAAPPGIVRFVSMLAKRRQPSFPVPFSLPADGPWGVKVLACQDRFVLGVYRRQMKAIGYLGQLEKAFGVPVTTRNWKTILAVARVLNDRHTGDDG